MKHLGKRFAAPGLTGAMALSMAACGGSSSSDAAEEPVSKRRKKWKHHCFMPAPPVIP